MSEYRIQKSEDEWREQLDPVQYRVLREKGTERPFTHEFWKESPKGTYLCAACETPLFKDTAKFFSACGWPAFYEAAEAGTVKEIEDYSHGMHRVEVVCAACGGHLGHVFQDAPHTPTGLRYCINGVSLKFVPPTE